jgi:hypothetical protein
MGGVEAEGRFGDSIMNIGKHIVRLGRAMCGVAIGAGLTAILVCGAEAQETARQVSRSLRVTRSTVDAAGGAVAGVGTRRIRSSSLGSGLQTGALAGRYRLTSGFVQRVVSDRPLAGDFNRDNRVDFDDFFLFAVAFGTRDSRFDLSGDGRVDFDDFFIFAVQFGKSR